MGVRGQRENRRTDMGASTLHRLHDIGETVSNPDEDVRGRKVLDTMGKEIGTVEGLMVDDAQNKVRFLRVEAGGFLGIGATHLVTIDRGGEQLRGAPRYDPALINEPDEHYWGGVYGYYGFSPFWGMGYMYPRYPYYAR